jgi:hypothetical protein
MIECSIPQRLTLLAILPPRGSLIALKIVRKLKEDLGFDEEEITGYKLIAQPEGEGRTTYQWDNLPHYKPIEFSPTAIELLQPLLRELIERLDKQEIVEEFHLELMEKFDVQL